MHYKLIRMLKGLVEDCSFYLFGFFQECKEGFNFSEKIDIERNGKDGWFEK